MHEVFSTILFILASVAGIVGILVLSVLIFTFTYYILSDLVTFLKLLFKGQLWK